MKRGSRDRSVVLLRRRAKICVKIEGDRVEHESSRIIAGKAAGSLFRFNCIPRERRAKSRYIETSLIRKNHPATRRSFCADRISRNRSVAEFLYSKSYRGFAKISAIASATFLDSRARESTLI